MTGIPQPVRGAGGKFAPRAAAAPSPAPDIPEAPEAAQRPATAELQRLAEARAAGGGLVLPLPPNAAAAGLVQPNSGGDEPGPNTALRGMLDYFEMLLEAGASPADFDLVWHQWKPVAVGHANPKLWVRTVSLFERLQAEAGRRHAQLEADARLESMPDRVEAERRYRLEVEQHELKMLEYNAAQVRDRIARLGG
jgi:hypothetical protein